MSIKRVRPVSFQKFYHETSTFQSGGTEDAEFEYTVVTVTVGREGNASARCDVLVGGSTSQNPYNFNFVYKGGDVFKEAEAALVKELDAPQA